MCISQSCIACGSDQNELFIQYDDYTLLKCTKCGLAFSDYNLSKQETEKYYNEYDYKYLIKYEEQAIFRARNILAKLKKYGIMGNILDIGSGCGFFLKTAREYNWNTLGIELSAGACDYSISKYGLKVLNSDVRDANLKKNFFDVISLQHILEHLPEPNSVLFELKDKLKDDGILIIVVPNTSSFMSKYAGSNWLCLAEKTHLFHYNKTALKEVLLKSGFRAIEIYSLQWDIVEVLWAARIYLLGNKKKDTPFTKKSQTKDSKIQGSNPARKLLKKFMLPINILIEKTGLGAELIMLAKKDR